MMNTGELAKQAKEASIQLASIDAEVKNMALSNIAAALENNKKEILKANQKDIDNAAGIGKALLKRLKLDQVKLDEVVAGVKSVSRLEDPVGKTLFSIELDKGLELQKVTCPIGVIGVIFESRPDALVQISSLCLKSGNAVILKGGSEAKNSNEALYKIIKKESEKLLPKGWIQLIETREDVRGLLKLGDFVDLIVPRGSNKFVGYIQDNTSIPVLGHSDGICHVYVDKDADMQKALDIAYDAKCQYPAVCNAMETLLVHRSAAKEFLPKLRQRMAGVELRGDKETNRIINIKPASEEDWKTEYNNLTLSIKIVNGIGEAIKHINTYGSSHTDAIVTESKQAADRFMDLVDSSSVMHNCSTRFADGYRYGLGAEVGISTSKLHARGPVGLEGLVIHKWKLRGNGHVVADYTGEKAKSFTYRPH